MPKRCWALSVNPIQRIISKIKNFKDISRSKICLFIRHNGHSISNCFFFIFVFLYVIIRVINSWLKCLNLSISMDIGYFTLSVRFTPNVNWMNEWAFLLKAQNHPHLRHALKWWLLLKIQLISVITAICSIMSFLWLYYYYCL